MTKNKKIVMTRKLLLIAVAACAMFITTPSFSQDAPEKADQLYQLGSLQLALDNYHAHLQEHPDDVAVLEKIANVYTEMGNLNMAIETYQTLSEINTETDKYALAYGKLLKKLGLYDQAKSQFEKYSTVDPVVAEQYILSCFLSKEILQKPDQYEIQLLNASSRSADFGVSFYNDNIVYCSFRNDINRDFNNRSPLAGNDLFVNYNKDNEGLTRISFLRPDLKEHTSLGPVTYGGNTVAYTKNDFKTGNPLRVNTLTEMHIYFGEITSDMGDWDHDQAFAYNGVDYSTGFPSLTEDGQVMYFCSNQEGGMGGFDIYVTRKVNGEWTNPQNLGPEINTIGNEITPQILDNELYFSSDYHTGLGGYDVFSYSLQNKEISNLGKVVNSPLDDYFYQKDPASDMSYVTSNRIGGKGSDDIYLLSPIETEEPVAMVAPQAVDLESLTIEGTDSPDIVSTVSNETTTESKANSAIANNYFSLKDAMFVKKLEIEEVEKEEQSVVYFIQLASLSQSDGDVTPFVKLKNIGDIFKIKKGYSTKIRLGYYYDRTEANDILNRVKGMGYNDAFVVTDDLESIDLELVESGGSANRNNASVNPSTVYDVPATVSDYKVRLASYTDPLWFDLGSVQDLGELEQWTKGEFTIFVLSGYPSLEGAQKAMRSAKNRGYKDAHIVIDNDGYLEKLGSN